MSRKDSQPYIGIKYHRNPEDSKMTTTKLLKSLLITVLVSSVTAHAVEQTIVINVEEGKQIASFRLGDSRCVPKNVTLPLAPRLALGSIARDRNSQWSPLCPAYPMLGAC